MAKLGFSSLLVFTLLLDGCDGPRPEQTPVRLLLDGAHVPDVLVERKELAWPPA